MTKGNNNQNSVSYDVQELVESTILHVVAAEAEKDGSGTVFIRDGDRIEKKRFPFHPFILLTCPIFIEKFDRIMELSKLNGNAVFLYIAKFANHKDYSDALEHLKKTSGVNPSSPNSTYRVFSDLNQQFLISEKFRLFRNMKFCEIRRLQLDIETLVSDGYNFCNAERENDKISLFSMSDNTGWEKSILLGRDGDEKEIIQIFIKTLLERDPDVIEGHNIFRFDLPYIEERAKKYGIKLNIGRNGSAISSRASRLSVAERTISYKRYDIYGRHIVDTYHLTQFYDISHRDLESYSLKAVAKHFGIASENRTYIEGGEISEVWKKNPQQLIAYGLDDVRETRALSEILSPSYFYQTQLVPYSYQNCIVRGNATRIDSLLVASYLDAGYSIPCSEPDRKFSGALTDALETGVFKNVWHCDVRSLYPSIIISEKWCPARDYLGFFPRYLNMLREFRLKAKLSEKKATNQAERDFHNAIQSTFKILINSFYGYLGFSQGTFNDFKMAEAVTAKGRDILKSMVDFLKRIGAKVIEIDTDGIYFQPPAEEKNPSSFETIIQKVLPEGIEVELDETFPAMFCYKSKNYALLTKEGEIAITGAALKSRGLEPFQRNYMMDFIRLLLIGDYNEILKLTDYYRNAIQNCSLPIANFAKTETLSESPENYKRKLQEGKAKRSAAYELALKSRNEYRQGDQISFYVTGNKKNVSVVENSKLLSEATEVRDENVSYYLAKLEDL